MKYILIWSEDDGDVESTYHELFENLEQVIDRMAEIKTQIDFDRFQALFKSEKSLKEQKIPCVPEELYQKKKKEKEIRDELERARREMEHREYREKQERAEYERLKKKYEGQ